MATKTNPLEIEASPRYLRSYRRLPEHIKNLTDKKILLFQLNPHHPSLKTHKLHGKLRDLKSCAINKNYRILFKIKDSRVAILFDIGTHKIYQ